ncbi:Crp/Fnr family transcriptional regulator [Aidingimonas halophila]|uniref:Crp-like helix-turn-helix domain-containing protein n=1 Tax=Aidingimonas halophila TaxID=574349 RepID=A0A1H2UDR3_9GAMM|nr:helix-turn-helix domain-containing protein [Aidingimonas halophila]GHC22492.1 hypothetical protein GCM10008094_11310 [Aidingimonas halophila]SDW54256.1 Crp-like helix-turn-helix domain-containing protein [Aidingimonas halophila]
MAKHTGEGANGRFRLPLSQEQLADALGLSAVHISRTFSILHDEGLVNRERHQVELFDLDALADVATFDACYLNHNIRSLLYA